ncbi:MAG: hypothetical protein V1722_05400 [Candidatus Micrarchaeota archaeon]
MELFSERNGYVKRKIQFESMDIGLRSRLWSLVYSYYLTPANDTEPVASTFIAELWDRYLKWPLDRLPDHNFFGCREQVRTEFFKLSWDRVYDFIEFFPGIGANECSKFMGECNRVLAEELAAYRFVDKRIVSVTSNSEISEIEAAIQDAAFPTASTHISTALDLLAHRSNPDYRNSIKESISAVEAVCKQLGGTGPTLTSALDSLEKQGKLKLVTSFKLSLEKLYGYTSSKEGIRHALLDAPTLKQEDAIFMLVACSAFVNYLKSKITA